MESTLTQSRADTSVSEPQQNAKPPRRHVLAGLRHQFLAIDVCIIAFVGILLAWTLIAMAAPGLRLYEYTDRYAWAEMPLLSVAGQLALILAAYMIAQRFGLKYHRDYVATGRTPPTWLAAANLAYVFIPILLLPIVFNLLGPFIAGVSGVPDIGNHPGYDPAADYDPAASWWDLWLKQADIDLFGVYPAKWLRQFHNPASVGFMMLCYLSYYVSPLVAVLPLLLKRDWRRVRRAAAIYAGTLLATYIGYIVIPATGPRFEGTFDAWAAESGWFATEWWQRVLDNAEVIRWDAFPSGHTAIAVVALILALRYHRRVGLVYLPFVAGLLLATVFLGYHYVTDVAAGLLFAAFAFLVIEPLVRWWEGIWKLPSLKAHD